MYEAAEGRLEFTNSCIMSFLTELLSLGFTRLPSLDQSYFKTHAKEGFFILANESTKQFYAIKTINAYSCLGDINSMLLGKNRYRALSLEKALHASKDTGEWEAFFRIGNINVTTRRKVNAIFKDFQSLSEKGQRIDDELPMVGWKVTYPKYGYVSYVFNEEKLTDEKIISTFLRHWRNTAIQGNRDKRIDLTTFYKVSSQMTEALGSWTKNDFQGFTIEPAEDITNKPRREARRFARSENVALANLYLKALQHVKQQQKESIDLESTP